MSSMHFANSANDSTMRSAIQTAITSIQAIPTPDEREARVVEQLTKQLNQVGYNLEGTQAGRDLYPLA